jgi:hypothetical protein
VIKTANRGSVRRVLASRGAPFPGLTRMAPLLAVAMLATGCSVALTAGTTTSARVGGGAGTAAAQAGYPPSFVGQVIDCPKGIPPAECQGLTVFSAATGQPLRSLTGLKDVFSPEVTQHPHVVYYLTLGKGTNCQNIMRIPYRGGKATLVRKFVRVTVGAYAVSPDGKMLAYQYFPLKSPLAGDCEPDGASRITVMNLVTGAKHTITNAPLVLDMAWAPNDHALALEYTRGSYATSAVQVISSPFSVRRLATGAALPCPGRVHRCLQFSPRYAGAGELFYLAGVPAKGSADRTTEPPCGQTCRYVLTRVTGTSAVGLTSATGLNRPQGSGWCAVDQAGNAALFTVPYGKGFATFRYVAGHVTRLKYAVQGVTW